MLKYTVKQCTIRSLPVFECTGAITGAPPSSMNSSYSRRYTTHLNTAPELPLQSQLWSSFQKQLYPWQGLTIPFYKGPLFHSREGDTQRESKNSIIKCKNVYYLLILHTTVKLVFLEFIVSYSPEGKHV